MRESYDVDVTKGWRLYTPKIDTSKCHNPKIIKNATLEIYQLETGFLYKKQNSNLVATILVKCDKVVPTCLPNAPETTVCSPTGHSIYFNRSLAVSIENFEYMTLPAELMILEAAIASTVIATKLKFRLLKRDIKRLLCNSNIKDLVALCAPQKTTRLSVLNLLCPIAMEFFRNSSVRLWTLSYNQVWNSTIKFQDVCRLTSTLETRPSGPNGLRMDSCHNKPKERLKQTQRRHS